MFSSWLLITPLEIPQETQQLPYRFYPHDETVVDSECLDPAQIFKYAYLHATQPLQLWPWTFFFFFLFLPENTKSIFLHLNLIGKKQNH